MTPIFLYSPAVRPALLLLVLAAFVTGCSGAPRSSGSTLQVVAAENMWGSIAAQLGGDRVHVTSIVSNPATDPHDYEPTTQDARDLATAQLVIENGAGYDPWIDNLLSASPSSARIVLNVGTLVGVSAGGNPHLWYSPANARRAVEAITADYRKLALHTASRIDLGSYDAEISLIRSRFAGVKVGASESIFAPLAQALGLDLITPPAFLKAISEGTDPTAGDLTTIGNQIATRQIKVWVFNIQNSTPDVQQLTSAARAHHIPVVSITETLSPAIATFQAWQVAQLKRLARALAQ